MNAVVVHVNDPRWKEQGPLVRKAVRAVLKAEKITDASVTIVLSNDAEVKELNHQYRGKNKPTNVLSFPNDESDETGAKQLGDIILAYETIAAEAKEQKKKFEAHFTHLVMHGVLHLLGYDHETAREAKIMESLEIKLLAEMGIANPYKSV